MIDMKILLEASHALKDLTIGEKMQALALIYQSYVATIVEDEQADKRNEKIKEIRDNLLSEIDKAETEMNRLLAQGFRSHIEK